MTTLKKLVGDGGAGMDKSHGSDTVYDVLKALTENPSEALTAYQATIATATLNGLVVHKPCKLVNFRTSVATTGTAGSTTAQIHKNGVSQGELTTANTEADGTKKSSTLSVSLVAGDLLTLVVSAAPTGGAGLTASAKLQAVTVE